MNIDIAALRMIEADKGISIETVITAIETALLTAYRHTDGFAPHARVDVNRKSGAVRVMAQEVDQDGNVVHEWDDTPEGFGRIAATTARQVILQRLRDAENEKNFGDLVAHEGEIVGGVVQQDSRANARGMVVVQIGSDANSTEGII
ncbi:NusA N-terminal domain-containing protein, partial [Gordonia sp. GAMMA]